MEKLACGMKLINALAQTVIEMMLVNKLTPVSIWPIIKVNGQYTNA